METGIRSVVEAIHASPTQCVIYLAGGASQALGWLLSVPRASATLLEAVVPYSRPSMVQLLGKVPMQFASRQTAEDIAMVAYNRALKLSMPGTPVAGIGLTGALVSSPPKRGDHRCHVSTRTHGSLVNYELTFVKGLRDRVGEDHVASQILIKALATACGVPVNFPLELREDEKLLESVTSFSEEEQINQLLLGSICMFSLAYPSVGSQYAADARKVVLSGSFNPLHEGHLKLLDVACNIIQGGVPCCEISVINADKPPLSVGQIKSRAAQFKEKGKTVVFTNQPYFYKKAELFPESTFVIGADTAVRLINPKYYENSHARMVEVLLGIQQLGCNFLVAGRNFDGKFQVLSELSIPDKLAGLFKPIPEEMFHVDISSTELRQRRDQQ